MNNLALTDNLLGSLALYLVDMKELKCAVVGNMSPLIQFSWASSILFSCLKKFVDTLVCLMLMRSGSPSRHVPSDSRANLWFVIDSDDIIQSQSSLRLRNMTEFFKKFIKKENHPLIPTVRYRTNFTNCILQAFQHRGWQRVQGQQWDIIWSEKQFIPELYQRRLAPHQKVNHFRNYQELCRKDQLIKNLKKHKKMLEREGRQNQAALYNFYPQTFVLPNQYVLFADEFKRQQAALSGESKNIWIMKPTGKSQGKGIFLFNKLTQVATWENHSAQPYIAQRYICDPLLIGGKKFDIRLYALVVSYSPLTVYFYRGGFARFTHCRYDDTKIQNSEIHLTNVAIQKHAEGYDEVIGGKWYVDQLKQYLLSKYGQQATNGSFMKVQDVIIRTLEALQKAMASDRNNSFELYGFDILLDSQLNPWLIQVNGSPSMTANTPKDREFKLGLLDDTLTVIDMEKFLQGNEEQIGGFDLIFKEKPKGKDKATQQKISFLGTFNNRLDNLKKLAKSNAPRLNDLYDQRRQQQQKKRVMSSSNSNNHEASKSSNGSKRNITNRKYLPIQQTTKVLTNNNNQNHLNNNSLNIPPKNKEFVIKNKIKREYTNENEGRP